MYDYMKVSDCPWFESHILLLEATDEVYSIIVKLDLSILMGRQSLGSVWSGKDGAKSPGSILTGGKKTVPLICYQLNINQSTDMVSAQAVTNILEQIRKC